MLPLPEDVVILLVDDSENDVAIIVRAMVKAQLRNRVVVAKNGEEAIAYFQGSGSYADKSEHPPAGLALVDLKMPKMDGFELLSWIRRQPALQGLPVVVLTSSDLIQDVTKAYELGANSFLVKPMEFDQLEGMMRTLGAVWKHVVNHNAAMAPTTEPAQQGADN